MYSSTTPARRRRRRGEVPAGDEDTGVYFDEELNWIRHAAYVKARVKQRVGMLARICGRTWGVLPDTAVFVYKVWVRPMIDYAGAV